jgi:hypothetical protein
MGAKREKKYFARVFFNQTNEDFVSIFKDKKK